MSAALSATRSGLSFNFQHCAFWGDVRNYISSLPLSFKKTDRRFRCSFATESPNYHCFICCCRFILLAFDLIDYIYNWFCVTGTPPWLSLTFPPSEYPAQPRAFWPSSIFFLSPVAGVFLEQVSPVQPRYCCKRYGDAW